MLPIASDTLLQQRYRILNVICEGEFARTYLATDSLREDAYCAIEELVPSTEFPNTVARAKELFKQEASLLAQLDHSQLPRFGTTFEEKERLFLVRDYVPGKTYGDLLAQRRDLGTTFTQEEVWQFLVQILPVLGEIHSKGAIHRNISPDSIICREGDGLPVPIDFGVVGEFAQKLQISPIDRGISSGQPSYAPPEQLQGGQVSPSTDLYALAVTAIVMLTGKDPSALFINGGINADWRKWTQIDDGFANIFEKMLAANPADRYQSALDAYQELQLLPLATPPTAENTKPPSQLRTVAVGQKAASVNANENPTTSLTALNTKLLWEKPQFFIPIGVLLSLLVGTVSFFGFRQFFQTRPDTVPVATTPPKQIDFNNPTIPNDTSTTETIGDRIEPAMDKEIVREGKVDPNNTVRYRVAATAGQYLDIKLVAPAEATAANATAAIPSPIASISPTPTTSPTDSTTPSSKDGDKNATNPPIAVPGATPRATGNQVLMSFLSPTGNVVDASAERAMGWRGQIPATGEYTIELRPIQGLSGRAFPYKLSVSQLTSLPSATPSDTDIAPTPSPSVDGGSTINSPANIDGTPTTTPSPDSVTPNSGISPVPIVVPSERPAATPSVTPSPSESTSTNTNTSETPRRRRRRRRQVEANSETNTNRESSEETTSRRRRRTQVDSSSEETPTPRRRRRRITSESSEENTPRRSQVDSSAEETPTPRRRRRRVNTEPTIAPKLPSTSTSTPASGSKTTNTPQPEPSVGIPVPPAKNSSPSGGGDNE